MENLASEEQLHPLRKQAEEGADLTALVSSLEDCFVGRRGVAVLASSTLTFFHAHRAAWSAVDLLSSHASANVRWGAVRALSDFLARHPSKGAPAVDRLGLALADTDADVRKQAFQALEQLRKAGHVVPPTSAGLAKIAPLAGRYDVDEILYGWAVHDRDFAARLRDLLPAGRLRTICEDVVAGVHAPPCTIC